MVEAIFQVPDGGAEEGNAVGNGLDWKAHFFDIQTQANNLPVRQVVKANEVAWHTQRPICGSLEATNWPLQLGKVVQNRPQFCPDFVSNTFRGPLSRFSQCRHIAPPFSIAFYSGPSISTRG